MHELARTIADYGIFLIFLNFIFYSPSSLSDKTDLY